MAHEGINDFVYRRMVARLEDLSREELVDIAAQSIEVSHFAVSRCISMLKSFGIDAEIVQELFEMPDNVFGPMWENASEITVVKVRLDHSDN